MIVAAPTQLDAAQSTELSKMQIGLRLAAVRGCFARFNRPPTNRTGTIVLIVHTGMLFYYARLIGLWLFVIVLLSAESDGIDDISSIVA
jgi:hypothetical protein